MRLKKKKRSTTRRLKLISHLRLPSVRRPDFADHLRFPEDITQLNGENVAELLGKYTLLYSYAAQDMAFLNQESLRIESHERIRRSEIVQQNPRINTIEKYKREAFFEADSKLRSLQEHRTVVNIRKETTGMFMNNFDKYIQALSRELTRKTTTEERERRFSSRN